MLATVHVAPGTFFAIIAVSALAGTVTAVASDHGVLVPVVVVELLLRVVLGPQALGQQIPGRAPPTPAYESALSQCG